MKQITKILCLLLISLFCLTVTSGVKKVMASSGKTTLEYDFTQLTELSDFQAIHTSASNGGMSKNVDFDDYWSLDEDGLTSINPSISSGSTDNISYLALTQYLFTNFEAEIVGRFMNSNSWGWMGLVYRQETVGRGFFDEGAFAGVQKEGTSLIWGSADQGGGPQEGNKPDSNPQEDKIIKVRVVGKTVSVTVYDTDNNLLSDVSNTIDERILTEGYVSIVSVDNHHNFTSFKITNLDENGEPTNLVSTVKMEQIQVLSKPTTMDINATAVLEYNILPTDENYKNIRVSSSDSSVVIASGNSLTAIGSGTAEINVYSLLDSNNCDSFTITVTSNVVNDGKISFVMDSEDALKQFKHNYVPDASGANAGDYDDYTDFWEYSDEYKGVMRINDKSSDPANDIVSLLVPGQKFTNYEMTVVYQNTNANSGWIGFVGLHSKADKRFMDSGFGAFVQSEGFPTIWGQGIGIHENKNIIYDSSLIHILKVKVYNGIIELYLDDMNTPLLSFEIGSAATNAGGEIGVFCSGAGYVIKSISYAYLNVDGTIDSYFPVTELTVNGVPTTAKVGDTATLEMSVNEDATRKTIVMESSDSNICIAKNGKLVFISSGEVTITVYPEDAKELAKEYVITVEEVVEEPKTEEPKTEEPGTETPGNTDDGNETIEPTTPDKSGCKGSLVPTVFGLLVIIFGLCAINLLKKKTARG